MDTTIDHSQEYLVYTRRSTDDLINQKNSIEYQVSRCLSFAASAGFIVAGVAVSGFIEKGVIVERHTAYKTNALDIGKDGTIRYKIDRPKFQKLVTVLASHQYRGVICLCWDRLSRNPHDDAVVKDLINRGADVRFVEANYENSSAGALHMDIDGVFAANYSRTISEKVRAANAKLRAEGKCTRKSPIGYLDAGPGNKPVDPARAPLVKRIFELYAQGGWSISQLAEWARDKGLLSKQRRPNRTRDEVLAGETNTKERAAYPVTAKTIEVMLHNPFYAGVIKHGDVEVHGIHEPLITMELFRKVQQMHRSRCTSVHYLDKPFFLYRGFLKCGCSRSYSPYEQKSHSYYWCRCREGCANDNRNLLEERVGVITYEAFGQMHLSDDELYDIEKEAPPRLRRIEKERADKVHAIESRQTLLQRDLAYITENKIDLLREGAYSAADFAAEVRRVEDEHGQLEAANAALKTVSPKEMLDAVLRFSELIRLAKDSYNFGTPDEKHRMLSRSISELVVMNGKLSEIRPKNGFGVFLKRGVTPFGGPNFVFSELTKLYLLVEPAIQDMAA
jgi:DNA invertase Pin-like site-specific DNA recombinase